MTPIPLSDCLKENTKIYILSASLAAGLVFIFTWFVTLTVLYVCAVIFLIPLLKPVVNKLISKKKISPNGKAVLISGCDSGFGHMLAQRMDDLGFHVFAGCLVPDGEGAAELKKSGSHRLHVISLDVTKDISVQEAVEYVKKNLKESVLWAVVNNAGILDIANIHWVAMKKVTQLFEINTLGVIRVTKAFLSFLKEGKGRLVTIGSAADTMILPGMVPYAMSKLAADCFCEGLRLEVFKWGVHSISIKPSIYKTPQNNREALVTQIDKAWESAPSDVKDIYDPDYIDTYKKDVIEVRDAFRNSNSSEVISTIEESIMTAFPECTYDVGSVGQKYGYKIFKHLLPEFIFIPLIRFLSRTRNI